jgi:hypothetical protein
MLSIDKTVNEGKKTNSITVKPKPTGMYSQKRLGTSPVLKSWTAAKTKTKTTGMKRQRSKT